MLKPILFNTDMVRAILDGRKTATRRVIKFPPGMTGHLPDNGRHDHVWWPGGIKYPPYNPGDILWVRETWAMSPQNGNYRGEYLYRADYGLLAPWDVKGWKPSIHMPKDAARIFLRVTSVRAERLRDISGRDLQKEGMDVYHGDIQGKFYEFAKLWDSTIKPKERTRYRWGANPWVWAIEFERCDKPYEEVEFWLNEAKGC